MIWLRLWGGRPPFRAFESLHGHGEASEVTHIWQASVEGFFLQRVLHLTRASESDRKFSFREAELQQ